jgi:hypothetical protein
MGDSAPEGRFVRSLLGRVFNPLWVLPAVIFLGLFLANSGPDGIESFYVDTALPFLIACWIGFGFTEAWRRVRESARLEGTPVGVVAATGILSALVLLSMLGGVSLLWEDPWMFGVAVAPGFAMARPALERWVLGRSAQLTEGEESGPGPTIS